MTMRFLSVLRVATAVLSFSVVTGCGSTPVEAEPPVPDFTGKAVSIEHRMSDVVSVLINDLRPPPEGYQRVVHIDPGTVIVIRQRNGVYGKVGADEIVVGAILSVKTTGVEMRSLPPQYDATWIEIIPPLPE
jgi:hypothetical protein